MYISQFLNSVGHFRQEITNDTKSILIKYDFTGPDVSTINAGTYKTLPAALATACNGKVTLTHIGAKTTTLISSRPLIDILELCGGIRGGVTILSNGAASWSAYFRIDVALNGTLKLNQQAKLVVEFEGFSTYTVGAQNTLDATLSIWTVASDTYSTAACVYEVLSINSGQTLSFDCPSHTGLWVPTTLDKLQLFSNSGIVQDYRGDDLQDVATIEKKHVYTAAGSDIYLNSWFLIPINNFNRGAISLASGTIAYLLSNTVVG